MQKNLQYMNVPCIVCQFPVFIGLCRSKWQAEIYFIGYISHCRGCVMSNLTVYMAERYVTNKGIFTVMIVDPRKTA